MNKYDNNLFFDGRNRGSLRIKLITNEIKIISFEGTIGRNFKAGLKTKRKSTKVPIKFLKNFN